MTFIYFLLALTVIICLHELGHLIAAKIFGVYCYIQHKSDSCWWFCFDGWRKGWR